MFETPVSFLDEVCSNPGPALPAGERQGLGRTLQQVTPKANKMIDQQNTLFFFTKLTNLSPERLKGGDFVDYREFSQSILLFLF